MSGEVLNSAVFSALFCCSADSIAGVIEDVGGKFFVCIWHHLSNYLRGAAHIHALWV